MEKNKIPPDPFAGITTRENPDGTIDHLKEGKVIRKDLADKSREYYDMDGKVISRTPPPGFIPPPRKEGVAVKPPTKPAEAASAKPETVNFERANTIEELYKLLEKTESGKKIVHGIMEVITKSKPLKPAERLARYGKFVATIEDPGIKRTLKRLLIESEERKNFSVPEAVAYHLQMLARIKPDKIKEFMDRSLNKAHKAEQEHKEYTGFTEALGEAYATFEKKNKKEGKISKPAEEKKVEMKPEVKEPAVEEAPEIKEKSEEEIITELKQIIEANQKFIEEATRELEELERKIVAQKAETEKKVRKKFLHLKSLVVLLWNFVKIIKNLELKFLRK